MGYSTILGNWKMLIELTRAEFISREAFCEVMP